MPTNDFLPFCATDTGSNLPTQSAYVASSARPIGNQPGVASSSLNNKPLRQATYVTSQIAQYISNFANVSVLDNATPAQLLSQIMSTFQPLAPVITRLLSGTGTWNPTFQFFIASGSASSGATYTNNGVTYTVSSTISAGLVLATTGNGVPSAGGGTLTKASGTGDSSIIFYAYRNALYAEVMLVGGGGGGCGSGTSAGTAAGAGGATTFGSSFLTAGGGGAGTFNTAPPAGGSNTINAGGTTLISIPGGYGQSGNQLAGTSGGGGGMTPLGGAGGGGFGDLVGAASNGLPAIVNSGSGGGGGGGPTGGSSAGDGNGGGAGGYILSRILSPSTSYAYGVGAAGAHGTAGANGADGADGGSGQIMIQERFQ